jgi:CheY-like chemotaxis protein
MASSGKHILVVDDEPLICELLVTALQRAGHTTVTVNSGEEALLALSHDRFDVAVVDIRLPGIDGVSVLEHVLTAPARPSVILMTGYPDPATEERLAELDHEGLLRKPFSIREVVELIRKAPRRQT